MWSWRAGPADELAQGSLERPAVPGAGGQGPVSGAGGAAPGAGAARGVGLLLARQRGDRRR